MPKKLQENPTLDKIREDLGSEFPFSALWQDEQPASGQLMPIINMVLNIITLIAVIFLFTKI